MAFLPDIVVTTPGEPGVSLVAEAKLTLPKLENTEERPAVMPR